MKNYRTFIQQEITELICDGCGLEAHVDAGYDFREFITIEHKCGYGAIHGDGKQLSIDLCQQCFSDMCGDTLTITDPLDNQLPESTLEYGNIFQAITKSKIESNKLKKDSDIRVIARDILSADKISNKEELQAALKRVEQLWDAQYHSTEGNELHTLADLICAYDKPDWNSFFEQVPSSDENFMSKSGCFSTKPKLEEPGTAKSLLKNISINKDIGDKSR